ncbi:MAG: LacI family DNA-binding transcriptional regulator [Spirochaetia bacterium]
MNAEGTQKKYLQIAEELRKRIESGVYQEGEMIPTIRQLAEEYGVNPQTVNKATAHLVSLGYLRSRQGAGSEVVRPANGNRGGIYMLIDENRSRYLEDLDDPRNYHGKDIYLTYLMRMSREGRRSRFIVYSKEDAEPRSEVRAAVSDAGGFLVQGTLPDVYGQLLAESDVPAVMINRRVSENIRGGRLASVIIGLDRLQSIVDYLVTLGHRRLLFVRTTEFERNSVYDERLARVRSAASQWRSDFDVELEEFEFDGSHTSNLERFSEFLDLGFTAAVGYNDNSVLQLYSLIQRAGLSVGAEFSVCGFDDINAARLATPPLTTVRVDRSGLVQEAFSLLDELAASPAPLRLSRTLETELVIRRSALPPNSDCR